MKKHEQTELRQRIEVDDEQAVCSNELLALMRQRMAQRRRGAKDQRPKDLKIEGTPVTD